MTRLRYLRNIEKKIVKRIFFRGFVRDDFDGNYPFDLPDPPGGYLRSFGDQNPDKTFYVIWRDNLGSGFFSNFSQVISHIMLAESFDMIPVVDYQNFKTLYNTDEPVNGSLNAWEYYFKTLSGYTLDEVYSSKRVFLADGWAPQLYPATPRKYRQFYNEHIHLQDNVKTRIDNYAGSIAAIKTLGIHFRGKEMNFTPRHAFGPTIPQIFAATDALMEEFGFEQIFLVTEELSYLDAFVRRYGNRVLYTDAFRTRTKNYFNINPRPQHRYLLGLEILTDAELLSKCQGLLGSSTGPMYYALAKSNSLEVVDFIYNGLNSSNYFIAKFMYGIRKRLPTGRGGLLNRTIRFNNLDDQPFPTFF